MSIKYWNVYFIADGVMDRFTPGEAYAFTTYELKKAKQQQTDKQGQYLPPSNSKRKYKRNNKKVS